MLFAGALPILSFPAANLEFLAWFGLVPGLVLIARSPSAREGGIRAWWLGAGYLIAALYWMAPEIGPAVPLVAAVVGVLWVPFGVAAAALLRPPVTWPRALAALVVVPSCWLLTEWLRSWQALGGPWAVYGVSQWQHPAVLALAAVGGVWLISIALVMANVAIVLVIGSLPRVGAILRPNTASPGPDQSGPARSGVRLRPGVAVLGLVAGLATVGAGPLAFALAPASPAVRQVTVAMVQPGIINDPVQRVDASEQLTAELSRSSELSVVRPDLIVWGESSTALDLTLAKNRLQLQEMESLASQDGADLLVNQDTTVPGQGQEKVGVLISPAGIIGQYIKTRLVPFGEYIPFRQQLGWLTKISRAASSNMIPGTGAHLLQATDRTGRPLPIGVLICFESAFPDMSRVDADKGAQLIVYQSATPTFQGTWGPDQQPARRNSASSSPRCRSPTPIRRRTRRKPSSVTAPWARRAVCSAGRRELSRYRSRPQSIRTSRWRRSKALPTAARRWQKKTKLEPVGKPGGPPQARRQAARQIPEMQEIIVVEEKLREHEIRAGVNLLL